MSRAELGDDKVWESWKTQSGPAWVGLGKCAKEFGFYLVGSRLPLINSELERYGMKMSFRKSPWWHVQGGLVVGRDCRWGGRLGSYSNGRRHVRVSMWVGREGQQSTM